MEFTTSYWQKEPWSRRVADMLTSYGLCWNPSLGTWDVKWRVGVECQRWAHGPRNFDLEARTLPDSCHNSELLTTRKLSGCVKSSRCHGAIIQMRSQQNRSYKTDRTPYPRLTRANDDPRVEFSQRASGCRAKAIGPAAISAFASGPTQRS